MPTSDRRPREVRSYWDGLVRLLELNNYADARGSLLAFDFPELPFQPRRSFIVHDAPAGTVRGRHAHVQGQQILCCLAGVVVVELRHAGETLRIELSTRMQALLVEAGVWAEQHYSGPEALLLVFASHPYNASAYVHQAP